MVFYYFDTKKETFIISISTANGVDGKVCLVYKRVEINFLLDCGRFLEVVGNNLDFKNQTSKRLREKNKH